MAQASEEQPRGVGDGRLVRRTHELTDASVRGFLADASAPRVAWVTPDGLELAGSGAAATVTAEGAARFDVLRERADRLFADVDADGPRVARPRLIGGLAFEADHAPEPPWTGFPAALFVLPRVQLTRADGRTWLSVADYGPDATPAAVEQRLDAAQAAVADACGGREDDDRDGGAPGVTGTRRATTEAEWTAGVERATERIRDGDLRKVVLATALDADLDADLDVPSILDRLGGTYPECNRFLVEPTAEAGFFGPTPERLVRMTGSRVETEALAGSAERGDTPEADAALAAGLETDEKIRHEQALVAETIRERLAPLGTVTVGDREVRRFANIQHLRTPITAELEAGGHVLDVVEVLHPTPAVGGIPLDAAREVIRETESFDRGWYASPIGWFDAAGDGEFVVGIRSAVAGGRHATLFAGDGIVGDSDPAAEWAELGPKFRPVLDELER